LPTATEPRSSFWQLDIVDGELYAATPSDHSIQVISLDGGPTGYRVSLSATPSKVKKGKRTTLTAKLRPCQDGDKARFQRKTGGGFDSLGGPIAANDDCKATKKVRITRKSVFRAVSIDSAANTLATSRNVTVKLR
jgi:hypothetical protein